MVDRCGHCGYPGELQEISREVAEKRSVQHRMYGDIEFLFYWFLLRCPVCTKPNLVSDWWCDEISDPEIDTAELLFPTPRDYSAMPNRAIKAYQEANRVKRESPSLYAVGIRRTLEAICKEEGAHTATLVQMLDELAGQDRLPSQLATMGHQLRDLGNLGAHADKAEVTADDVPVIEDFAEAIIEYIYRAPAKIEAAEKSLEARQKDGSLHDQPDRPHRT